MNEGNKTNLENTSNNTEVLSNVGMNLDVNQTNVNEENINISLNEMEATGTTLGVNPPSENMTIYLENNPLMDNSLKPQNNKKKIIIIVSAVIGVILLVIIAMFLYIKFVFNASKYLDEKINEFTTKVNETFASINLYNKNQTYRYSGSITPNTNIDSLTSFNDTTFNFDLMYDTNIIDLNFDILKKNESIFNGELYLDNNNFYLNSADLYPNPIYTEVETNVGNAQSSVQELTKFFGQLNYLVINFVDYFGVALNEAEVSTKINGLTAIYTYAVNDENKEAFVNKFNDLVKNDIKFQEAIEAINANVVMDTDTLENFAIEIVVKIPSSEIKCFNFVADDETIIRGEKLNNEIFRVTFEDTVIDITTNDYDRNITWQIDNNAKSHITYNLEQGTIYGSVISDIGKIEINLENIGDNKYNYNILFNDTSQNINVKINVNITQEDDKITSNGNIKIDGNSDNLNFNFNLTIEYLKDSVKEKNFNEAISADTLTDEQMEVISNNLKYILTTLIPDISNYFVL